jgi:hypothetical protein
VPFTDGKIVIEAPLTRWQRYVSAGHSWNGFERATIYGPEGARDAVRAGADSLEHTVDLDDATLAEMARKKMYYVPTIDHNRYYVNAATEHQFHPDSIEGLNAFIARNFETAKRAFKAGVPFAMGSDAVYTMFGQNKLVRETRNDARTSAEDRNRERGRSAGNEARPWMGTCPWRIPKTRAKSRVCWSLIRLPRCGSSWSF